MNGTREQGPRLRHHRGWLAVGWALVALVVWASLSPQPPPTPDIHLGDKLAHLLAYGVLMGWFAQIYPASTTRHGIAAGFVFMGVVLEYLQGLLGGRLFEIADMAANTLGVALAWWITRGRAGRILRWVEDRLGA